MAGLIFFNVFLIFVILFKTLPCLPTSLRLIPVFIPWSSLSGLPTFPLWVPVLPLNYLFPDSLSSPCLSAANLTEAQVGQTHTWDTLVSTTLLLILFVSETVLASGNLFWTQSNLLSLNYWRSCPTCQQSILCLIFIYIYHMFGSFLFTHEPPLLDHNHLRSRSMFISQLLSIYSF